MNGDFNPDEFQPSFIEDGGGITGGQGGPPPFEEDNQDWDTDAWSRDDTAAEDFISGRGGIEIACAAITGFATGETSVTGVTKITFNNQWFKIHDNGGGEVLIDLNTCNATCP